MLVGIEGSTTRTKKEGSNKSSCANKLVKMEALYDQEGTYFKHRAIFFFFFFSNIGSTATEEMHFPYSKQGKQQED
jgi:hypothetical protein